MLTETIIEDDRWAQADLAGLAERAASAALGHVDLGDEGLEIAVLGCDDARIASLNADFRQKDRATNVLSWPSEDRAASQPGGQPRAPLDLELGDIAIAYDTTAQEAEAAGKPLAAHTTHLLVHAILHLLGYDHETDADAALMEAMETAILTQMGEPAPYG